MEVSQLDYLTRLLAEQQATNRNLENIISLLSQIAANTTKPSVGFTGPR